MFFLQLKQVWKNRKISLKTKIRILEATVMTVVKYGSEAWTLQKADENLLDISQRNCLHIVLGTRRNWVPGPVFQTVGCTNNVVQPF